VLEQIKQLAGAGITIHVQIVLCPGINDGAALSRTVDDLAAYWPQVASVGIVPVGLTRFRSDLPHVRAFTAAECARTVRFVSAAQKTFVQRLGASFVYLADEFFIRAGVPFPKADSYDGYPQLENGIGMGRLFQDEFHRLSSELPWRIRSRRRLFVVTGRSGAVALGPVIRRLNRIRNLEINLVPISSTFFGPRISVTGLLTGRDLIWGLRGLQGEDVLLPGVMLKRGTSLLLDGISVEQAAARTGCRLMVLEPTAAALIEAVLNSGCRDKTDGSRGINPRRHSK
jgi:putative radical SAM enzyme (TIGR03279 family)